MTIADKTFTAPWDIFPQAATGQELGHAANRWDVYARNIDLSGTVTLAAGLTLTGGAAAVITVNDNVANALTLVDAGGIEYVRVDSQNAQPQVHWNLAGADIDYRWESVGVDPALFVQGSDGYVGIGIVPTAHLDVQDVTVDTTAAFTGVRANHIKTAGVTDHNDFMIGLQGIMEVDQVGGVVGDTYGCTSISRLSNGTIGTAPASLRSIYGFRTQADLNRGTITGNAYGVYAEIDQEAANTIAGDANVLHLIGDFDGTVTGTSHMLYLDERDGVDYGIYQNGTAPNLLGGITTLQNGLTMTGGANAVLTVNDNVANAHTLVDAGAIEYLRYITTNAQPVVVWNEGGADIDYRWEAVGVDPALFIQGSDGYVGIGIVPTAPLDISSGKFPTLLIGADFNTTTRTDATAKYAYLAFPHYTNAEETIELARLSSSLTENIINIGGESASFNAATSIAFWTGATNTTTTGTQRMVINNVGNVGIGTPSPQGRLHGYDTISGFMHWEHTVSDAAAHAVIPNGAGDVTAKLMVMWAIARNDGFTWGDAILRGNNVLEPGSGGVFLSTDGIGNDVSLTVNADGSVDVQRTADDGSNYSYEVVLWLIWI